MKKNLKPETNLSYEEAIEKYGPPPAELQERPDLSQLKEDAEDVK